MTEPTETIPLRAMAWRQARRRKAARATPWSRLWVNAILARYLRRFAHTAGSDRVFARPLSLVRDRWFFAAQSFFPQIHLAIQPLLRPRFWQMHPTLSTPVANLRGSGERSVMVPALVHRHRSSFEDTRPHTVSAHRPEGARRETASRTTRSPLALVVQRLREPERAIGVTATARAQGLSERPVLVDWVAARSRRVERSQADASSRVIARSAAEAQACGPARHDTPNGSIGGESSIAWAARAREARWNGSRHGVASAPLPSMTIAAITDRVMQQIDDRLHAWQERTGF